MVGPSHGPPTFGDPHTPNLGLLHGRRRPQDVEWDTAGTPARMGGQMLHIKLFGATSVTMDGETGGDTVALNLGGVKPRQILEVLALAAGNRVPKERLADLLWDGAPPPCYLGTLESYVCVLRRGLGLTSGRRSALATVMRGYVLDPGAVSVDLLDFRRLVRLAGAQETGPTQTLEVLQQALALVGGPLLADEAYGSWAVAERETFTRELVTASCMAATCAIAVGAHEVAVSAARRAIATDMLAEQAWCLLMRAQRAAGRPTDALRTYLELRGHLAAELGSDPSVESRNLYVDILRDVDADADRRGGTHDPREEVQLLMHLLRQVVATIPGWHEPRDDRTLALVAARLDA